MLRVTGAEYPNDEFTDGNPALKIPASRVPAAFFNAVQAEITNVIEAFGLPLTANNDDLKKALSKLSRHYPAGAALPTRDIGPIWHADYNSWMTWRVFNQNGANYTGYASVDIGFFRLDTQPSPRKGWVKTGVAQLSKTDYAALFHWAANFGLVRSIGAWQAGMYVFRDNGDNTFGVPDVRGEFFRALAEGRNSDPDHFRGFGGLQYDALQGHGHVIATGRNDNGDYHAPGGISGHIGIPGAYQYTQKANTIENSPSHGVARVARETRPRNVALLGSIKI